MFVLHAIAAWDRLRIAWLQRCHPGLTIHPEASSNYAVAEFRLEPGARLEIRRGAVTERRRAGVRFLLAPEAHVVVGEGAWLRSDVDPVRIVAFAGARIELGPESFLNGCHVSAKREVWVGRGAMIGPATRVFDADQHDLDDVRPERVEPVRIGDHAWIASDATVLRGVRIGAHAVVGTRSLVTSDVPDHALAYGSPARVAGPVGDRRQAR